MNAYIKVNGKMHKYKAETSNHAEMIAMVGQEISIAQCIDPTIKAGPCLAVIEGGKSERKAA